MALTSEAVLVGQVTLGQPVDAVSLHSTGEGVEITTYQSGLKVVIEEKIDQIQLGCPRGLPVIDNIRLSSENTLVFALNHIK